MPQPVKISDALIEAAREVAPLANRSLAAQVEHWAALGRSIEGSLTSDQSTALKRAVRSGELNGVGRGEQNRRRARDLGPRDRDAWAMSHAAVLRQRVDGETAKRARGRFGSNGRRGSYMNREPAHVIAA